MSVIDEAAGQARVQATIGFTARYGRWCRDNPQWSQHGDLMAKADKFLQTAIAKRPDLSIEDVFQMLSTFMQQRHPDAETMDYSSAIHAMRQSRNAMKEAYVEPEIEMDAGVDDEDADPESDAGRRLRSKQIRQMGYGRVIDAEQALKPGKAQRATQHPVPRAYVAGGRNE